MPQPTPTPSHHAISAKVHFATGFAVVIAAAILSYFLHDTAFGRHLEMANLDAWFGLASTAQDPHIAVVAITDEDYAGPVFHRASPLPAEGVAKLIHAVALSRPAAIVVDLDTSEWKPSDRDALQSGLQQLAPAPQIAWAIGGARNTKGILTLRTFEHAGACLGVPASIPDNYGVVRGYLPYVASAGVRWPSLAEVANHLDTAHACPAAQAAPAAQIDEELPEVDLIEYSGGPARFIHLAATALFGAADTPAWRNANPLQGKIVIVGGQFQEARDRYVTPAGYLDGVDILAHAIASQRNGGIPEPSHRAFLFSDLALGCLLVTLSFFVRGVRMLAITFVAIPFVALGASFALYHYTGYFLSFMPILAAVFLHHLVEHSVEHWQLVFEHAKLEQEVLELRARLHAETRSPAAPDPDPAPEPPPLDPQ